MKRFSLFLIAILSIFALVACSNQTQGDKVKGTERPKELTALEVLTKANETMKAAKGYEVEGSVNQKMIGLAGQPIIEQKLTMNAKVNNNPAVMHVEMTMDVNGMNKKTEVYADQQNMYIFNIMTQQWVKVPAGVQGMGMGNDPIGELQIVKSLLEQLGADKDKVLQMKKENGQYVITLNLAAVSDKKEIKDLVGKIAQGMGGSGPDSVNIIQELSSNMKIEKKQYVYYIDEKTFELKKQDSEVKMQTRFHEKKVVIDQKMSFNITKSDQVVTIPEEVKQKAQAQ